MYKEAHSVSLSSPQCCVRQLLACDVGIRRPSQQRSLSTNSAEPVSPSVKDWRRCWLRCHHGSSVVVQGTEIPGNLTNPECTTDQEDYHGLFTTPCPEIEEFQESGSEPPRLVRDLQPNSAPGQALPEADWPNQVIDRIHAVNLKGIFLGCIWENVTSSR